MHLIIRTIRIKSAVVPVYSCVRVYSENPILYSENDYLLTQTDQAEFLLPLYPSNDLIFNYGTNAVVQKITVEQIYYSADNKGYYSLVKTISTEDAR